MISNCRNCGHPVKRVFWFFWFHLNDYGNQLTKRCNITTDCDCSYPEPEFQFRVHKITTPNGEYDFDKNILKLNKK